MFIATLNQTLKSYVFAIIGAEYILRWLPIGTHDWNKFVKPEKLEKICNKKANIVLKDHYEGELNIMVANNSKAINELKWKIEFDLEKGLHSMISNK